MTLRGAFPKRLVNKASSCECSEGCYPASPSERLQSDCLTQREGSKAPSSSALHGCAKISNVTSLRKLNFFLVHGYSSFCPCGWSLTWVCGEVDDQHGEEHLTGQSSSHHNSRERGGLCLRSPNKCALPGTQLPSTHLCHLEVPLSPNNAILSTWEF